MGTVERLVEVVHQLSLAKSFDTIVDIVRSEARALLKADGATVIVRDGDFSFYVDEDAISPLWKGARIPLSACVSGWVMEHKQAVSIKDVFDDSRVSGDLYRATFVHAMSMVPIRTADPLGAIGVYWASHYRASEEQMRLLQVMADATAVAMEDVAIQQELEERVIERNTQLEAAHRELRELTLMDEATGLYNRRGFELLAMQLLGLAQRSYETTWLLLADIDGLQPVNDGLGRIEGNKLLEAAARILREAFRGSDVIARMDEAAFAVLGVSNPHPADFADRLQLYIDAYNQTSGAAVPLTMSIGLAQARMSEHPTLGEMLNKAEEAISKSKRTRRNPGSVACN
ncbi:MAG: diguanylate cyclase [Acidobacteriota bacterium]|nr:diguanylate cyclase [Acidobacteriota bacterium]